MKTSIIYYLIILLFALQSCNQKDPTTVEITDTENQAVVSEECYQSVFESDTLNLALQTLKSGKVAGNLDMRIYGQPAKIGKMPVNLKVTRFLPIIHFTPKTTTRKHLKIRWLF